MWYVAIQLASPPEVKIILHPQESMSAATAYTTITLVVQFTRLYPHEYVFGFCTPVYILKSADNTDKYFHLCYGRLLLH